MKYLLLTLALAFILALAPTPAFAGPRTSKVGWDASPSPASDIAGYKVYTTTTRGTYTFSATGGSLVPATQLTFSILNLSDAVPTWAVVTAVGTSGLESGPSNEIIVTGPMAPPSLRLVLQ